MSHVAMAADTTQLAAGARVLSEPEDSDHGDRIYRVEDLDGHRWMFATPL